MYSGGTKIQGELNDTENELLEEAIKKFPKGSKARYLATNGAAGTVIKVLYEHRLFDIMIGVDFGHGKPLYIPAALMRPVEV